MINITLKIATPPIDPHPIDPHPIDRLGVDESTVFPNSDFF